MADVYCAEDTQLGRQVALKLLYRRFAEDDEFVERFRREASSAAGLQHPNIVQVFDRGEWDGTYYIAMEYLEGRNLKQVVRDHGALDPALAVDLVVPDPQGRPLRAPARHRPPRHQAAQRDRRRRGASEGHRLRDRARRHVRHDRDRRDHGHRAVPLARAGAGPPGRRARRPLLDRHRALRAADRGPAVRRRVAGHDRAQAGLRGPGAADAAQPRGVAGARRRRDARAPQGPRAALPGRRRVHLGARLRDGGPLRRDRGGRRRSRRGARGGGPAQLGPDRDDRARRARAGGARHRRLAAAVARSSGACPTWSASAPAPRRRSSRTAASRSTSCRSSPTRSPTTASRASGRTPAPRPTRARSSRSPCRAGPARRRSRSSRACRRTRRPTGCARPASSPSSGGSSPTRCGPGA